MSYRISVWFLDALNIYQLQTLCENLDLGKIISFEEENRYLIICAIIDMTHLLVTTDKLESNTYEARYESSVGYGSSADLAMFDAIFLRNKYEC